MDHHATCQRFHAWDMGEHVPCTCPRGWPRRSPSEKLREQNRKDAFKPREKGSGHGEWRGGWYREKV